MWSPASILDVLVTEDEESTSLKGICTALQQCWTDILTFIDPPHQFHQLTAVVAHVYHFIHNLLKQQPSQSGPPTSKELSEPYIKTHGSELRGQEGTKCTPIQKKCDHYCESFTWRNGFAIFKNITSYFKIRMAKSQTHEKIHPSYHRHKTFVLVLYTIRSFRAVCAVAC